MAKHIKNQLLIIFTIILEKIKSKILPKAMKDTYEISDDAEKFIVDIFSKIDSYIDLDFMRVDSPS